MRSTWIAVLIPGAQEFRGVCLKSDGSPNSPPLSLQTSVLGSQVLMLDGWSALHQIWLYHFSGRSTTDHRLNVKGNMNSNPKLRPTHSRAPQTFSMLAHKSRAQEHPHLQEKQHIFTEWISQNNMLQPNPVKFVMVQIFRSRTLRIWDLVWEQSLSTASF